MKNTLLAFVLILTLLSPVNAAPPTSGQFLFQRKPASGPFEQFGVTPVANRAFGWDGTDVVMFELSSTATTITGTIPYTQVSGLGAAAIAPTGATGLLLLSNTSAAAARITLGLVIGTNVQAWDADLDTWAGKTPYAGNLVITTGKTLTSTNTLTFAGTDGSTLNIGAGGTLGSAAYSNFDGAFSSLTGKPTSIAGYGITDGVTLTGAETLTNKTITGGSASNLAITGTASINLTGAAQISAPTVVSDGDMRAGGGMLVGSGSFVELSYDSGGGNIMLRSAAGTLQQVFYDEGLEHHGVLYRWPIGDSATIAKVGQIADVADAGQFEGQLGYNFTSGHLERFDTGSWNPAIKVSDSDYAMDAGMLSGAAADTDATPNTIAKRDGGGGLTGDFNGTFFGDGSNLAGTTAGTLAAGDDARFTTAGAITILGGTLVAGTATISNEGLSGKSPWVQSTNSSITNMGALSVTVSGTTATIKSMNVLDTSTFNLFFQ